MYLKCIKKIKPSSFFYRIFLYTSALTLNIYGNSNVISQPLLTPNFNEINKFSNKSFITKAIEKTGASVVTIERQKYVKKRKFSRD